MKPFNFGHFNTDSTNFTLTVIFFFQKETKTAPKSPDYYYYCISRSSRSFGHFPTISNYFKRFPNTTEDVQRLLGPSTFEHRLKVMSDFIVDFYQEQIRIDDPKTMAFYEKPFKPTRVFHGTVNIKK